MSWKTEAGLCDGIDFPTSSGLGNVNVRAEVALTKEGKAIVDAFDRFHEKYDELITNGLNEMLADIKNNITNS